eukprot:9101385-Ditylum_brightwellii.AAC.1
MNVLPRTRSKKKDCEANLFLVYMMSFADVSMGDLCREYSADEPQRQKVFQVTQVDKAVDS